MNAFDFLALFNFGIPELLFVLVGLGFLVFWIWMLIDCVTNESDSGNKVIWLIVLLITGVLGAAIYFFARKLDRARSRA